MGCIIGTFPSACAQEGGGAITPLAYAFHPTICDIFDRSGKTNFAAAPPFSGSVSPDIQLLSSEARKATIAATSSGRPERLTVRNCLIIGPVTGRSEEHTSELQSLMRISYAVFCLKTKQQNIKNSTI